MYIYRYVISGILLPLMLIIGCVAHKWLKSKVTGNNVNDQTSLKMGLYRFLFLVIDTGLPLGWKLCAMVNEEDNTMKTTIQKSERKHSDSGDISENSKASNGGSISLKLTLSSQRTSAIQDALDAADNPMILKTSESDKSSHSKRLQSTSIFGESFRTGDQASLQLEMQRQFDASATRSDLVLLFSRETYVLRLAGEFAVLLTFGVVFPPLAIVLCIAILSQTLMSQRLVSRLLMGSKAKVEQWEATTRERTTMVNTDGAAVSPVPVTRYDMLYIVFPTHFYRECGQIREFISLVIPYISVLMMMFLSFSLFDTMADSDGNESGFLIMAVLAIIPILEYFVRSLLR